MIHAGTKQVGDTFVSNGGRVLLVGSVKPTIKEAHEAVYRYLTHFDQTDDFFYRKDIGKKA